MGFFSELGKQLPWPPTLILIRRLGSIQLTIEVLPSALAHADLRHEVHQADELDAVAMLLNPEGLEPNVFCVAGNKAADGAAVTARRAAAPSRGCT